MWPFLDIPELLILLFADEVSNVVIFMFEVSTETLIAFDNEFVNITEVSTESVAGVFNQNEEQIFILGIDAVGTSLTESATESLNAHV